MSPEQLQGAKDIDGRADLFSLGCVAYECLTGRPAFAGDNLGAVLARLASDNFRCFLFWGLIFRFK